MSLCNLNDRVTLRQAARTRRLAEAIDRQAEKGRLADAMLRSRRRGASGRHYPDPDEHYEQPGLLELVAWVKLVAPRGAKSRDVSLVGGDGVDRSEEVESRIAQAIDELGAEFDFEAEVARYFDVPVKSVTAGWDMGSVSDSGAGAATDERARATAIAKPETWHDRPPLL